MPVGTPLERLEAALAELQASIASPSSPDGVPAHAQAVRAAMGALADWVAQTPADALPHDFAPRMQALGAQLGSTREQLARVLAITGQQAASLLPPAEDAVTYGPSSASKARIYRAPG